MKIGDGKTKVNDLPFVDDDKPGQKTELGGEIFNDYENNKALADKTLAAGNDNWAGYYGFKI